MEQQYFTSHQKSPVPAEAECLQAPPIAIRRRFTSLALPQCILKLLLPGICEPAPSRAGHLPGL